MTRFSNPLPQGQVPNTQGRPAGPGAQPQHAHANYPEPDLSAWPAANDPRTGGRPAARAYPDQNPYADPHAGAHHDPYAALRPDGFGYQQPQKPASDPYGLAGYSAPQPAAPPPAYSRAPQAPAQPSPYGQQIDPYGAGSGFHQPQAVSAPPPSAASYQGAPTGAYGNGYAAPSAAPPAPSPYAAGFGVAPQQSHGYADQWQGHQNPPQASPPANPAYAHSLSVDARDYGHPYGTEAPPAQQWTGEQSYGEPSFEPSLGPAPGAHGAPPMAHGYGAQQPPHGSFEQSYAEDETAYEDGSRRGSWKKVVALVACTVLVGGVLTIAYTSIMGSNSGEPTPLIKGADGPSKVKPSDPGGKQFAHADSKIMGRLGEGGSAAQDPSGVRKVPVVVVGRDGSIQAPEPTQQPTGQPETAAAPSPPAETTSAHVTVPGLTVIDGLGGPSPSRPVSPKDMAKADKSPPVQMVTASADPASPVVVTPPVKQAKADSKPKPEKAKQLTDVASTETAALPARTEEAPPAKKQRVAALDPAPVGPKPTGAGYVAVLASVPASGSSRMDALKQFADMQQKYASILTNKTPDIQEANLGDRGTYHRLLVGPPGSRDSATNVCTQLKAQGYSSCWVTAY